MKKRILDELKRNGASEAHATSDDFEDEFEEIFGFTFPSHSVSVSHSDALLFGDTMLLMTVDAFNAAIREASTLGPTSVKKWNCRCENYEMGISTWRTSLIPWKT